MRLNKTVATVALGVSSSAFAFVGPGKMEFQKVCLQASETAEGLLYAGDCNQAQNNEQLGLEILENGCAAGQIALTASKQVGQAEFYPYILSCAPPNIVQL